MYCFLHIFFSEIILAGKSYEGNDYFIFILLLIVFPSKFAAFHCWKQDNVFAVNLWSDLANQKFEQAKPHKSWFLDLTYKFLNYQSGHLSLFSSSKSLAEA